MTPELKTARATDNLMPEEAWSLSLLFIARFIDSLLSQNGGFTKVINLANEVVITDQAKYWKPGRFSNLKKGFRWGQREAYSFCRTR